MVIKYNTIFEKNSWYFVIYGNYLKGSTQVILQTLTIIVTFYNLIRSMPNINRIALLILLILPIILVVSFVSSIITSASHNMKNLQPITKFILKILGTKNCHLILMILMFMPPYNYLLFKRSFLSYNRVFLKRLQTLLYTSHQPNYLINHD
jgi:ribonucleotide reductase beta subunit family protein with ferritin-like domain